MLNAKWDLLILLFIALIAFSAQSVAADHTPPSDIQTTTGHLRILAADNFETGISQQLYAIRVQQADGRYRSHPLSFSSTPPDNTLRSGDQVTVTGRWIGKAFVADSIQRVVELTDSVVRRANDTIIRGAPLISGERNALLVIVNMSDVAHPGGDQQIKDALDGMMYTDEQNVNGLYRASSFNQMWFERDTNNDSAPDVFGPYTIAHNGRGAMDCNNDIWEWANAADQAIAADPTLNNFDLTRYQHRIYYLPSGVQCGWDGMGQEGCEIQNNTEICRSWIREGGGKTLVHELGHNLEWEHASTDANGDGRIDHRDIDEEYGDLSGIMGFPDWAQANAPHRDQLQWYDDTDTNTLVLTTCNATFHLDALELNPATDQQVGTQVVKIPKPDTNEYYYLSYRRRVGAYPSHHDYANKINIHRYAGRGHANTVHVVNLGENETFEDTANGILIRATDVGNNIATVTVEVPNEPPSAVYSYTVNDLSVRFISASSDGDGTIASHQWDFGDGESSNEVDPSHSYTAAGTYRVELTVTDDCNQTATVHHDVAVASNAGPTANFTSSADDLNVQFTDTSEDNDGTITSYQWDFGDGISSIEADPFHIFTVAGTYTVRLTVTDNNNATHSVNKDVTVVANKPPITDFTYTAESLIVQFNSTSEDSDGTITSHNWKFGDGVTSKDEHPSHTYAAAGTYTVQLTVTDNDGVTDTEIKDIEVSTINVPPTAEFTLHADTLNVAFTNDSIDSDGDIVSNEWDFGDGVTSEEESPGHTYATAGTYKVTLVVTDDDGVTDTETKNITVDINNVPPTAAFSFTTESLEVQFSDTSTDNDGNIATHQWDFGDGVASDLPSPSHTFPSAGTYTVQLTVTDDDGESNTFTQEIAVDGISPLVAPGTSGGGGGGGGGCFIRHLF